jgi:murein L,D-transpeptidase YcbB/YkuD
MMIAGGFAAVAGFGAPAPSSSGLRPKAVAPAAPVDVGEDVAAFYRERDFEPLWVAGGALRPAAGKLLALLEREGGLDRELAGAVVAARSGERRTLARADLLLSRAFAGWAAELHRPPVRSAIRYVDAGLAAEARPLRAWLDDAAAAPSLEAHLDEVRRVNPALDGLRRALAARRAGLPREAQADEEERLILANIERARDIPARRGRYLLVDAASARLWMIENNRIAGSMRVIVGKAAMPTPAMAGMIRYAVLNPYWNLPPDLIRERARKVLRRGTRAIAAERLQILADWSPRARTLSPRQVDWPAVAAGRRYVNLRQRPGPANMMGAVKFMMPNDLGVYLHDTPLRDHFARDDRRISSGCVRLEDAPRLARWLFRGAPPTPSGAAEQRVDLPEPVPVYITYLTALPSRGGVEFIADRYGRDRALLARLRLDGARTRS